MSLTNAQKQQALRDRRRVEGLKLVRVWVKPEHVQAVKDLAVKLNK